jgi:hypothetical protein
VSEQKFLQLLGYAPDASPTVLGVLTGCSAVVPSLRGLKGAPSPAATPLSALAARCLGSAVVTKLDGTTRMFAGTTTKLYEAGSTSWTDLSGAATFTASTTARWRFAQQENVSFAVNGADSVQASVSTGDFSSVAGSPIAKIVEVVGKFVFALNTSTNTHGVQWCALGDYTDWAASIATQAGSDTLEESPGPITAGKRFGNALVVFKKNSMYLGQYAGPPNIWTFALLPGNAGALSQESVVNIGTAENPKLIFMGEDDFYLYDGSVPIPIGTNRVKNEVYGSLVQTKFAACAALHNAKENLVYFYYPSVDSSDPNSCRVYNYRTDKWGADDRQIEAVTEYVAPSISYSGLGTVYTNYQDLPNLAYGVALVGSTQTFPAIFDTSHQLKTLTGVSGDTSLTTGDLGDDQAFTTLTRIVPRFTREPASASMTNMFKNTSGGSLTNGTLTSISSGRFDVICDARWHRLQFAFRGDWEMSGIVPEWERSGQE